MTATADTVPSFILRFSCPDRPGIIAAVSAFLFQAGCDVREASQYGDPDSGRFFVRMHCTAPAAMNQAELAAAFEAIATAHQLTWQLHDHARRLRTVVAVSRSDHCLNDLLHRWHSGLLHTDIAAVVSNHPELAGLARWYGVPFHHLPVDVADPSAQPARLHALLAEQRADLLVLARYMQILPAAMCSAYAGRIINIHHSFLPGFKGARPYHQAHDRGVKLIGATAHFVTPDLDEGPIIEQDVVRVNHTTTAADMVNLGREVEARVLARAVRWFVEHRIELNGPRTIVFQ